MRALASCVPCAPAPTPDRRPRHTRQLKEELGPKAMAALELPGRRALTGPPRGADAVERRRRELEAWAWRVVAHPDASRTRSVQAFLELGDAARTVARSVVGGGWQGCGLARAAG